MDAPSGRQFANAPFLIGTLLLVCALTFYYFTVLRVDYTKTPLLDLTPHPDATEYFAQAKALLRDGWPSIQIGYEKLPSRYPPGYPALMLPWLKILPEADAVPAPFRTSQTAGTAVAFGRVCFLHIPGDAVDGRVCVHCYSRHASRLLYFLSFVADRRERLRSKRARLYVCLSGC